MAAREHHKDLPGHKPGTPWGPEEWAVFKAGALENGAEVAYEGQFFECISWKVDGRFHRDDGPAAVCINGIEWWYQNGELHRLDGPAITYFDGKERWFNEGDEYTDGTFAEIINP